MNESSPWPGCERNWCRDPFEGIRIYRPSLYQWPPVGPSPWPVMTPAPQMDPLVKDAIRKGLATMSAEELRKYIERMYGIEEP